MKGGAGMDANGIITVIQSVGFPIVMCGAMGWYVKYITDKHNAEMQSITSALNNNTVALTKLCEKLERND
jgi:hypothetical protein